MFKKSTLVTAAALCLTACSSNLYTQKHYKITDEETIKWIEEGNKVEQCIFSKQWSTKNYNGLSEEENMLHSEYVYKRPLISVIGINNFNTINQDKESQLHIEQQFHKFNHANKIYFEKNWCNDLKKQYKQDLVQVKDYFKQQKAQAAAQKKAEVARQKQEEKERKAREAYYRSPQGKAELARQQRAAEQRQMQEQILAQQRAMQQAMEYQQMQSALQQQQMMQQQQFNQNMQMINNMNQQMRSVNQNIGQGWAPTSGVHWNNVYY